jgi:hypothetical protein
MHKKYFRSIRAFALLLLITSLTSLQAQRNWLAASPSTPLLQVAIALQEELKARYPQLQATRNTKAKDICKNGGPPATLTIQRSGLAVFTGPGDGTCAGRYQDGLFTFRCGRILKPGERATGREKVNLVPLEKGDKVFSTGIYASGDSVAVGLGSCSGPKKGTLGVLGLTFQFPKGYLLTASADNVDKIMGEFFVRDGNESRQPVKEGQTMDEVVAAMGQPQEKLKAGNKEIYLYKDVKITFVDGKVSSVEQNADVDTPEKR